MKYDGMSVNERLWASGLEDEFNKAIDQDDLPKVRAILEAVDLHETAKRWPADGVVCIHRYYNSVAPYGERDTEKTALIEEYKKACDAKNYERMREILLSVGVKEKTAYWPPEARLPK